MYSKTTLSNEKGQGRRRTSIKHPLGLAPADRQRFAEWCLKRHASENLAFHDAVQSFTAAMDDSSDMALSSRKAATRAARCQKMALAIVDDFIKVFLLRIYSACRPRADF